MNMKYTTRVETRCYQRRHVYDLKKIISSSSQNSRNIPRFTFCAMKLAF